MYRCSDAVLPALRKKFGWRPLRAAAIAGAVVLVFLGMAAPALADDPPRAVPVPRAGRAAPSGTSYEEVINHAKDSARDMTALQQQAREVAAARNEAAAQISTLAALTQKPSAVRDRLEREALRLSASTADPVRHDRIRRDARGRGRDAHAASGAEAEVRRASGRRGRPRAVRGHRAGDRRMDGSRAG